MLFRGEESRNRTGYMSTYGTSAQKEWKNGNWEIDLPLFRQVSIPSTCLCFGLEEFLQRRFVENVLNSSSTLLGCDFSSIIGFDRARNIFLNPVNMLMMNMIAENVRR